MLETGEQIIYNRKLYTITGIPRVQADEFPACWNNANDNESCIVRFVANATDYKGYKHAIYYEFDVIKGQEPEYDEFPWNSADAVKRIVCTEMIN
jgi:hypothetical protein